MKIKVFANPEELGQKAAEFSAAVLKQAIAEQGYARILLSTGASQFDTVKALTERKDIEWEKVEMFHLDEYVNLPIEHPASFRRYLKERFTDLVKLKKVNFVNTDGDLGEKIGELTKEIRKKPIDLALIGIGENAHIAFNDPPADFETQEAYIVVDLNEKCKQQQVHEGWFKNIDEVPKQAVSLTVHQIMQSKVILSCVPYKVKAEAIKATLSKDLTNMVPATMLKRHANFHLYLDEDSAALAKQENLIVGVVEPGRRISGR